METEFFIHTLFNRLRRRRFPLAYEDYQALRLALRAGFGWESPHALCEVCCALWAKSLQEREMVTALFQELCRELEIEQWELPELPREEPESEQIERKNLRRVIASEVIRRLRSVIPIPGKSRTEKPVRLRELLPLAKQICSILLVILVRSVLGLVLLAIYLFGLYILLYYIFFANYLILKIFLIIIFIFLFIALIISVIVYYQEVLREAFHFSKLKTQPIREIPPVPWQDVQMPERTFTFVPQFPLAFRESVQAWRRLWRPVREGAPTELDIDATVDRRSRLGIASSIVLVPPRRNKSRLLLLVDREGSMQPFHQFGAEVCRAVQQSGRMEQVALYYFHDVPVEGADESVLTPVIEQLFPTLDPVLTRIEPLADGNLFDDPEMLSAHPVAEVLETVAAGADVVLISDGGAARGRYDMLRLLDTIAFLKALRTFTQRYVWLNPLPEEYWENSTAAQIARHVPMFPLTRDGLHRAVNVLHGKPYSVERPF